LRNLISCCKLDSLKNRIERKTPGFKRKVSRNAETIRELLQPEVEARIGQSGEVVDRKTVVDLAVKELVNEDSIGKGDFVDEVIANLKIFLFAGHETTAQTLYVTLFLY
jgi:cytochrome P450